MIGRVASARARCRSEIRQRAISCISECCGDLVIPGLTLPLFINQMVCEPASSPIGLTHRQVDKISAEEMTIGNEIGGIIADVRFRGHNAPTATISGFTAGNQGASPRPSSARCSHSATEPVSGHTKN
ncbi:hypothetical protein MPL3356_420015 [Mesorhizobium plurifarium]|uniref:Uncharacterized protein n=1 Tax=Mesorhizobium plurifarium TaxID=69974 RepID=A0A090E5E8_MESPL|nr:hypothetical protein MPL3356_420015 [Mesorhizobium plurifarium]